MDLFLLIERSEQCNREHRVPFDKVGNSRAPVVLKLVWLRSTGASIAQGEILAAWQLKVIERRSALERRRRPLRTPIPLYYYKLCCQ